MLVFCADFMFYVDARVIVIGVARTPEYGVRVSMIKCLHRIPYPQSYRLQKRYSPDLHASRFTLRAGIWLIIGPSYRI